MPQATEATILMIEDNKMHRFMYDFQFKQMGYKNFTAVGTAEEGLEKIKENPSTAKVPVIILSNKREKDMAVEVKRLGAVDYILKAKYLPREIVDYVGKFLGSHGFQNS